MELSVDEKIKAAIEPLLERITLLQTDNQRFKEEIAALQALTQPKTNHKPPQKPAVDHGQRPQTTKGVRKQPEHHEVKPDPKANVRVGQKKEEVKVQQEQGKGEVHKVAPTKVTAPNTKPTSGPIPNKDVNAKPKPTTATGSRPSIGANSNKGVADKKPNPKSNEAQPEKKQQGEEEKKHTSQQKQHKTNSTHGVKSPVVNKPKPVEKPGDKKVTAPSPAPTNKKQPLPPVKAEQKPLKGGKAKPEPQPVKEEPPQPQAVVEAEKVEVPPSTENHETKPAQETVPAEQVKVETTQPVAQQPKVQPKVEEKEQKVQPPVQSEQVPAVEPEHKQEVVAGQQQAF